MMAFKITRQDGRSAADVVLDLVKGKSPGTVFSYQEIGDALSAGTNRVYNRGAIQAAVLGAHQRMLKEQARALHCVPNVGYRLAPAAQHLMLANNRKTRADKQLRLGVMTLQNVRWDELDDNQRKAHEGQLLVSSALLAQIQALDRRQSAVEDAIRRVLSGTGTG